MNTEDGEHFYRNVPRKTSALQHNDLSFEKYERPQERYLWEMRSTRSPNTTPASTVLNSPDLTELQYSQQQQQLHNHHHQIRVGRSPVGQMNAPNPQSSPTDENASKVGGVVGEGNCVRDGEIVVFDDIDTNWIKRDSTRRDHGSEDVLKVTKMIGQLPINDYEGSPRRIGFVKGTSTSALYPTRLPGFPQRISPKSSGNESNRRIQKNLIDIDNEFAEDDPTKPKTPTFDYLYEFSETRKVLEEFFKPPVIGGESGPQNIVDDDPKFDDLDLQQECRAEHTAYIGQRLARSPKDDFILVHRSPNKQMFDPYTEHNDIELYIDSNSRSSGGCVNDIIEAEIDANLRQQSRNFTLSPETTDYDSNCGDLDSLSNDLNIQTDYSKLLTSMPVLEDGLSSGHASDTENNITVVIDHMKFMENNIIPKIVDNGIMENSFHSNNVSLTNSNYLEENAMTREMMHEIARNHEEDEDLEDESEINENNINLDDNPYEQVYSINIPGETPPPPPAPAPHRQNLDADAQDIQEALKDIRSALQRAKTLPEKSKSSEGAHDSPVWIPRRKTSNEENVNDNPILIVQKDISCLHQDEDDLDTDLETDRLLGQQRLEEQEYFDEKQSWTLGSHMKSPINSIDCQSPTTSIGVTAPVMRPQTFSSATIRQGIGTSLTPTSPERCQIIGAGDVSITSPDDLQYQKSPSGSIKSKKDSSSNGDNKKARNKEGLLEPAVLIEGVLFRAKYLGSTQLVCEGQPTKSTRMMQAEEAVSRIKAPEGETQPSTEVDLFISTEKIMVLNTDLKEIMMDHALRTISYIADIGDLVVLMARRRFVPSATTTLPTVTTPTSTTNALDTQTEDVPKTAVNRTPKMICHVFESDEAQFIAQSIGQAFQVAYMEFLKANGIEDHSFVKEMDYQEVLNSQEIFGDELEIFAKKELQKEVVVPKAKGEILGVVIVESGWGSMLPTVVIANLMSSGAAARCGQLNIGDQLIAINGMSLVGLPLSTCQSYIRNAKTQTAVKFTVVPCAPVVEVKIKRPNTKYQLGFSVQNGVICSLLRGGIAERGGVRVGHRIIEINNQSVVAVPHEKIVNLLATSVGEILMKTMPTSMFRLLTGQENPIYI